jgi:hypothetical protein
MKLPIFSQSVFLQCRKALEAWPPIKRARKPHAVLTAALFCSVVLSATACSSGQAYHALQGWQRNECNKRVDLSERDRCTSQTNTSYEAYRRQIDEDRKP